MVRLEYFTENDFQQLIDWISDEHLLMNWSGSLFRFPLSPESLAWYIKDTNDLPNSEAYIYKAIDTETGHVVGHISLGSISKKNNSARISRVLIGNTASRGKGYCAAMAQEVLKIGFQELNLHRISLGVYDFNTPAIRCYTKVGFVHEGLQRDVLKVGEEYWSLIEMGILQKEWKALNS